MFPSQASLSVSSVALIRYAKLYPDSLLDSAIDNLVQAQELFGEYYQLFHSIQWNRSRVAVKKETEAQLKELAQKILQQIGLTGKDLNFYLDRQQSDSEANHQTIADIKRWNHMMYHLILAKQWLSNNLLNNDVPHELNKFKPPQTKDKQTIETIQLNLL